MQSKEYEMMAAAESGMWWYRGLHSWMIDRIRDLATDPQTLTVLDCGAGTRQRTVLD